MRKTLKFMLLLIISFLMLFWIGQSLLNQTLSISNIHQFSSHSIYIAIWRYGLMLAAILAYPMLITKLLDPSKVPEEDILRLRRYRYAIAFFFIYEVMVAQNGLFYVVDAIFKALG